MRDVALALCPPSPLCSCGACVRNTNAQGAAKTVAWSSALELAAYAEVHNAHVLQHMARRFAICVMAWRRSGCWPSSSRIGSLLTSPATRRAMLDSERSLAHLYNALTSAVAEVYVARMEGSQPPSAFGAALEEAFQATEAISSASRRASSSGVRADAIDGGLDVEKGAVDTLSSDFDASSKGGASQLASLVLSITPGERPRGANEALLAAYATYGRMPDLLEIVSPDLLHHLNTDFAPEEYPAPAGQRLNFASFAAFCSAFELHPLLLDLEDGRDEKKSKRSGSALRRQAAVSMRSATSSRLLLSVKPSRPGVTMADTFSHCRLGVCVPAAIHDCSYPAANTVQPPLFRLPAKLGRSGGRSSPTHADRRGRHGFADIAELNVGVEAASRHDNEAAEEAGGLKVCTCILNPMFALLRSLYCAPPDRRETSALEQQER
jgi:hypothetical protein